MEEQKYTADDIQVLGDLEAVRLRPAMYIGSTDQRGLHHLVYEIVDNCIDAAMAGSCDKVLVEIGADCVVKVSVDGRGIPVEKHATTGVSALETVMTILHAGGKFGHNTYKVSGGLHGVGASVVNALSSWTQVDVRRNGQMYRQEYNYGVPNGELRVIGETEGTGTTTSFLADTKIFQDTQYDPKALSQHFREVAYLNKGQL